MLFAEYNQIICRDQEQIRTIELIYFASAGKRVPATKRVQAKKAYRPSWWRMSFLPGVLKHRVLLAEVSCARQGSFSQWAKPRTISSGRVPKGYTLPKVPTAASTLDLKPRHQRSLSPFNSQRFYCALHSLAMSAPAGSVSAQPSVPADEHRLPLDVKPIHYDVTVRTDLEKLKFDGSVAIEYVLSPTDASSDLIFLYRFQLGDPSGYLVYCLPFIFIEPQGCFC